jgi:PAS domain S-box-containing protein
LLGTVAALAVAIPTIFHAFAFVEDQERKIGQDNLELARVVGMLTERRIDQTLMLLDLVVTAPELPADLASNDTAHLTSRLERAVRRDGDLTSILLVDRNGVAVAHTLADQRLVGQSLANWPLVQAALQSGTTDVGSAIRSPVTGRAVAPFAMPVRGQNGEIIGAALTFLSLEQLDVHLNGAHGPGRGLASIVDDTGRLLTSPDPHLLLTNVSSPDEAIRTALGGSPMVGRVQSATGASVYAAAIPIAHGWVVEVQRPVDAVLAPLHDTIVRAILIALSAFVAAMLLGIIAARRVTEPLLALLRALRSIRQDEARPHLQRSSTAEVAWLADELDSMQSALDTRTAEMRHALETLSRYRLLAERMTDLVIFIDRHANILDLNRAAETSHGYEREELIGRPIYDLLGGPEDHLTDEDIAQAFRDGLRFEGTHRRRDGTTFPVETTMIGTGGRGTDTPPILMAIVRDISARRAVEAALRASEAQYRGVVDNVKEIVFQVDTEGRWTLLNPAWTEVTEYTVEESLGRSAFNLIHADDRETAAGLLRSLVRQEIPSCRVEQRWVTKSGDIRWLDAYASLTHGPDGTVLGVSGTLRDVTERRLAEAARSRLQVREQEARASEERAAEVTGIVKHMPCGVLVFDNDSCLTLANERALEMLSPTPSDADGPLGDAWVPHPSALLEERLLNPCRSLVARALGGSVVSDRELQMAPEVAGGRILLGSAAPLRSANGEVRGAVAILTDVTRERRLMQDLVLSEGTLRHSLESLLVLHEAGRALSSTLVEEEIGRRFVESCVRIARLDAALMFLDDGQGRVRPLGAAGDPLLIEHVLACEEVQQARQQTLACPPSTGISPVPPCQDLSIAVGHHLALSARGRSLGILEIYGTEQLSAVTEDALASLAAHAVSAFENAHLYREVGDREQRLQEALRQLLIAQEEERRRVAYELHDGLAQVAAATHLSLQTFASHYRPRSDLRQKQLEKSVELARRVVREARQVIAGLRPTTLDDFGLERALRLHVQELVGEGWTIDYDAHLGPERLPGPIETVLYRIAQEALTNVQKHAETLAASVRLRRQDGYVELDVIDRGAGFKQASLPDDAGPGHHIGLVGMRERAALVGGQCIVESQEGQGTRVAVRIPLQTGPIPVADSSPDLPAHPIAVLRTDRYAI